MVFPGALTLLGEMSALSKLIREAFKLMGF